MEKIHIKIDKYNFWNQILLISNQISINSKINYIFDLTEKITKEELLKCLFEIAEYHYCKLEFNLITNKTIEIFFKKIKKDSHIQWNNSEKTEKYGVDSDFFNIKKLKEPYFLLDLKKSLQNLEKNSSILILGINKGEEIDLLEYLYPEYNFEITSVDFSASIINHLSKKYLEKKNYTFIKQDLNHLEKSIFAHEEFDLILSIGTLQSSTIDTKRVFMYLIQNNLTKNGKVIVGNPNCRYLENIPFYGTKIKNFTDRDLSLIVKDIHFYKKYLQQHKYTVRIYGKNYIFLTGNKIKYKLD